ncbi:hypothetical protein [Nocardioides sp. SYSU D00038]|uniref:hypothetical protein n=1 Tax=Nocardioides sp. SYSU D00038 TaxID=2812554 RepID=UPI0019686BB9|nr:hypothetical protein [Nocardioides sp. SYSU D00038]
MTTPYTAPRPPMRETAEELRARIPGWGVDLDPADRPSYPRERYAPEETGAHWTLPEPQDGDPSRERSIEHSMLPPVYGTSCPTKGLSGVVRRYSYARFSEGRAAHWLLLLAADRIDVAESVLRSFATTRPDNPLTQTGLRAELTGHGLSSRRGRVDARHHVVDPVVVAGPWVLAGWAGWRAARRLRRALGR